MAKSKRIKTYHGVYVPGWREDKMGKCVNFVFVITGRIPSKKNELVAVVERKDAFAFIESYLRGKPDVLSKKDAKYLATNSLFKAFGKVVNSKKYQEWEQKTVELLKNQQKLFIPAAQKHGIVFPLSRAVVNVKFYWKGKYKRDNSNKSEGIHDALVAAHILLDDSDRVMPNTSQQARDYSEEILESMAVIYITVPIPNKKAPDGASLCEVV